MVPAATVVGSPFQQRVHVFTSQGASGVERMHGEVYDVGPGCIVGEVQEVARCPWYYLVTSTGMTWVRTRPVTWKVIVRVRVIRVAAKLLYNNEEPSIYNSTNR